MPRQCNRIAAVLAIIAAGLGLSAISAQTPGNLAPTPALKLRPRLDPAKLTKQEALYYLAAQRGADWLQRCNRPDGRFGYVTSPALRLRQENESFARQAGAASTLGKAASLFGDERAAVLATQTVLTLLVETRLDETKRVRTPAVRASLLPPLASAGLLLQAIHDLPNPGTDLLDQSEQLCQFVRLQQKPDGSLGEADDDLSAAGEALFGLMRSLQHRPASWKVDVIRKAHAFYQPRWQAKKNVAAAPRLCAAWAEAFQLTKEPAFAESVLALADWLSSLQYQKLEPARAHWFGGFQIVNEGKAASPPDASTGFVLQALADGRRVARLLPDAPRHKRYQDALEKGLLFMVQLQYTEANTQHFADRFRSELLGAFHASHEDGNIRLDYTGQAVAAFTQFFSSGSNQ